MKDKKIDLDKILEDEKSPIFKILEVLTVLLIVVVVIGLIFGGAGLIIWGIGNAIIWLFHLSATWTFLQSLVTALIVYGIGFIIKSIF